MNNTRRRFVAVKIEEQPDGSAVLLVRTSGKRWREQDLEIHLAPHVYDDVAFEIYRKYSNQRETNSRVKDLKRRLSA